MNDKTEWYANKDSTRVCRTIPKYDEDVYAPPGWDRISRIKVLSLMHKGIEEVDPAEVGFEII